MANPEHVAVVKQGAEAIQQWREAHPEAQLDLAGADLSATDLRDADLRAADLRGADLSETDFSGADLRAADLHEALLLLNVFGSTNFTGARGLDTCQHFGPSSLDYYTLRRSGPLPRPFLQGCGLNDWEIEATQLYQSGLTSGQITDILYRMHTLRADAVLQFFSCFISYSHADQAFAHHLHDQLQERGIRCWLDEHQLLPGDDIYEQIDRGIRLWDKVLLCCSAAALKSWWVDHEIDRAFEKERQLMRERGKKVLVLIPLALDDSLFQWQSGKAHLVRSRIVADFLGWEHDTDKVTAQLDRIIRALRADDGAREASPVSRL